MSAGIQGSHAVASPSGEYIATISNGKLRVYSVHAPERFMEAALRVQAKDVTSLKWNEDNDRVAVFSAQSIEVVDLNEATHRVRIDNGSGGLGRFASADFVGADQLLVIWEFGKAKIWDLSNGKAGEIIDVKTTCSGARWQLRPGENSPKSTVLATLSRPGSDDFLNLYFSAIQNHFCSARIPTVDAQSLSWSPDGRWIAVLDTPSANQSLHIYTASGHHFRSYPSASETSVSSLGVKSAIWSSNSHMIALTKYDGKIVLLNTRTFTPIADIEHTTTIDQRSGPDEQLAPIWQETVSAAGERSYVPVSQPFSPPLSKTKSSTEPNEVGVAEARFSCNGTYLATRDERMLNSVWIWNTATLQPYAVLVQHSTVRKLHWHPEQSDLLMVDCGEGIAYLFDAATRQPPQPQFATAPGSAVFSWIRTSAESKPVILAASKSSSLLMYPEGQLELDELSLNRPRTVSNATELFEEGESEDSLLDVLSGRKPMPPKTEPSYTEMIDVEVETEEEDMSTRMDDTFREKKSRKAMPIDPFDDSEIF